MLVLDVSPLCVLRGADTCTRTYTNTLNNSRSYWAISTIGPEHSPSNRNRVFMRCQKIVNPYQILMASSVDRLLLDSVGRYFISAIHLQLVKNSTISVAAANGGGGIVLGLKPRDLSIFRPVSRPTRSLKLRVEYLYC